MFSCWYLSLLGLLFHFTVQYLCIFSLILQGLHEEGECRQLEYWPESGAKLRYLFCATPNAVKINEDFFPDLSKILGRRSARGVRAGGHKPARRGHPLGSAMRACGQPTGPLSPLFCYMEGFVQEKNQGGAFLWFRHRHEAELEQNQSRAPVGRSYRGNLTPGGGNRHHRHHQHSSHRRGLVTINIFINTISSPNPSSSLVTNLRLATPIGTFKVASSVDYSL